MQLRTNQNFQRGLRIWETCVKFNPSIWDQYFPPKHDTIHLTEAGFTLISGNTIYTNPRVFGQLCSTLKFKEWTNSWSRWGNKKDLTSYRCPYLIWSTFLLQKYTILIFMSINKKKFNTCISICIYILYNNNDLMYWHMIHVLI